MKSRLLKTAVAFVTAIAVLLIPVSPAQAASKTELTPTQIYENCVDACVQIKVTDSYGAVYIGSGFYVGKYNIMTNAHVIDNASKIEVLDREGNEYTLKSVYGYDEKKDLALLRVKVKNKNYLEFGDVPAVGSDAFTIGSPLGIPGTFTSGMIANSLRVVSENNYVQIDIPGGIGIGGGPLLNTEGKVVGVMCLTVPDGSCMNMAIRPEIATEFLDGLKKKDRISLEDFYADNEGGIVNSNVVGLDDVTDFRYTSNLFGEGLEEMTAEEIYEMAQSSVCEVFTTSALYGMEIITGSGSGCFVGPDTILTANHIVENKAPGVVFVVDKAGNLYKVDEIIYDSSCKDIAGLKVSVKEYAKDGGEDFVPYNLNINPYYIPAPGETVYALGNPAGYEYTLSAGIVRVPTVTVLGMDCIFHQAATSNGSSGGALLNKYGQLIAITNMILTGIDNASTSVQVKYAPESILKR